MLYEQRSYISVVIHQCHALQINKKKAVQGYNILRQLRGTTRQDIYQYKCSGISKHIKKLFFHKSVFAVMQVVKFFYRHVREA